MLPIKIIRMLDIYMYHHIYTILAKITHFFEKKSSAKNLLQIENTWLYRRDS